MADWTFKPASTTKRRSDAPTTLVSVYEDDKINTRRKSTNFPRAFQERYIEAAANMESMLDFFESKGVDVTFTKVSYYPNEITAHEETVRFVEAFEFDEVQPGEFETTIAFEKVF